MATRKALGWRTWSRSGCGQKVNWGATYANALASKTLPGAKLPVVARSDADALSLAVESLVGRGPRRHPPRGHGQHAGGLAPGRLIATGRIG